MSTEDAGNVGGAMQQVINELGQRVIMQHHKEGTMDQISHLSPGTQPEPYDLTRTKLSDKPDTEQPQPIVTVPTPPTESPTTQA